MSLIQIPAFASPLHCHKVHGCARSAVTKDSDSCLMKTADFSISVVVLVGMTVFGAACVCEAGGSRAGEAEAKPRFVPLKYNTRGTTYMKAGLCSSAVVGDFDGDGDDDVYLASGGNMPMGGTWYFENVSPKGAKGAPTAFKPRVRRGHCSGGIRCMLADGTSAVVARRKVNYRFERDPSAFEPLGGNLPENLHFGKVRANYWRLKDFDGDGRDLLGM